MNERLKIIRKKNHLTQEEFGNKIGIGKSAVSYLESGRSKLTEQNIISICREFSINETWLRTGKGNIEVESSTFSLDKFVKERGGTELELELMKAYFDLDPNIRKNVIEHFKTVFAKSSSETATCEPPDLLVPPETAEEFKKLYPPVDKVDKRII